MTSSERGHADPDFRPSPEAPRIRGLILAAGFSRRFGDQDKRCLRLPNGQTLLGHTLAQFQLWLDDLVVVIRPDDNPQALGLPDSTRILRAPHAHEGMGSSLADAVQQLIEPQHHNTCFDQPLPDALAIMLGDLPQWQPQSGQALEPFIQPDRIVRPVYPQQGQNQPGHPVVTGRRFWPELAQLQGDQGARLLIKKYPQQLIEVAVDHPGVMLDLDS